ncbi:MAG: flagellar type III secretion system pore protein FliP [Hyphomicrobium sp.]|nr:flagellar type III secretion system pore protein FliP [Hyphomicrobium sp.]
MVAIGRLCGGAQAGGAEGATDSGVGSGLPWLRSLFNGRRTLRGHKSPFLEERLDGTGPHSNVGCESRCTHSYVRHRVTILVLVSVAFFVFPALGHAQTLNLENILPEQSGTAAGRIIQALLLLTVLSVAPGILVMMTCFTRFIVALSFLRAGLGLQTTPSNLILINLALFMTWFVMAPTFEKAWDTGMRPLMEEKIPAERAVGNMLEPFKEFMKANVRSGDLTLFQELAQNRAGSTVTVANDSLQILVPAFVISELRRGFEIGFLIALPFLVIDMVVASVVMSMGMMMLSPIVFSLPLKVLFFVLIDGWNILVSALIRSYA